MANILFLTERMPWPIEDGASLRVLNLAKELSKFHACSLTTFSGVPDDSENVARLNIFSDIKTIEHLKTRSWRRHFRLSDENFLKLSSPLEYERIINFLTEYIKVHNIDIIIAMGVFVAEFLDGVCNVKKVIDDCDSRTLSAERNYQVYKSSLSIFNKLKYFRDIFRIRNQESTLAGKCDLITTVSPIDLKRIKHLNNDNILTPMIVVPNGVTDELLSANYTGEEIPNSIAFWGNLAFPPNRTAIEYFCEQIYLPYLQQNATKWYVIGNNPGPLITERAAQYDNIILMGFVADLFELVSTIPVMINPMVTGSGQKNKVLEAFMLAKGVVSTTMGMESFPVQHNRHCLISDTPEAFAHSVIELLTDNSKRVDLGCEAKKLVLDNYTWEKVGRGLNISIEHLLKLIKP